MNTLSNILNNKFSFLLKTGIQKRYHVSASTTTSRFSEIVDAHSIAYEGRGKEILCYFLARSHLDFLSIRHEVVARHIGCSPKTVSRWVKRFHNDGIITKQQNHKFSVNQYRVNLTPQDTFKLRINNEPRPIQNAILASRKASLKKPSRSSSLGGVQLMYFNNNKYIYIYPITRARACEVAQGERDGVKIYKTYKKEEKLSAGVYYRRCASTTEDPAKGNSLKPIYVAQEVDGDGFGYVSAQRKYVDERKLEGIAMLRQAQKDWIMKHGDNPGVKVLFEDAAVRKALITSDISEIAELLDLDARETMKMIAYTDEAVAYTKNIVHNIVYGVFPLKNAINDRMGWLISVLDGYCKRNKLSADWKWYFKVCEITGIQGISKDETPKPLMLRKKIMPVILPSSKKTIVSAQDMAEEKEREKEIRRYFSKPSNPQGHSPLVSSPIKSTFQQLEDAKKEIVKCEHYLQLHEHEEDDVWGTKKFMQHNLEKNMAIIQELEDKAAQLRESSYDFQHDLIRNFA